MTFRPAALTEARAADRPDRHRRTARTAVRSAQALADRQRSARTARAEPGPVRRAVPGARTAFPATRSAVR